MDTNVRKGGRTALPFLHSTANVTIAPALGYVTWATLLGGLGFKMAEIV